MAAPGRRKVLRVTARAAQEIRSALAERGLDPRLPLRIELPGEDDEGFRWVFRFGDEERPGDSVVVAAGLKIRLDPVTAERLDGCELDFVDSTMNRGFVMREPAGHEPPEDGMAV
jgi:iron-sulfur cluster assembly accessory protein